MLKLTLDPDGQGIIHTFSKPIVTLGCGKAPDVDISIVGEDLLKVHVKIIEADGGYLVINAANDPFVSINGLPFGKKPIKPGDRLQVGKHELLFDLQQQPVIPHSLSEPIKVEKEEDHEFQQLMHEAEKLGIEEKDAWEGEEVEEEFEEDDRQSKPLQIDVVHPFKEPEGETILATAPPSAKKSHWRVWLGIFTIVFGIASFVIGMLYYQMSDHMSLEERAVAGGIADIAMGLSYSKIHHITPAKQNWANPEFLHNNITQILSPKHRSLAVIDADGHFTKHPYLLRIYTSHALDQFIIIAQPSPGFFQNLTKRSAIVLDSKSMELRKISDLRSLNRLLARPTPLNSSTSEEISHIIKQGTVITLNELSDAKNSNAFSPPRTLTFIRPQAGNFVYNAPRYFMFGEELMNLALNLKQSTHSTYDLHLFQSKLDFFAEFPDIILYGSKGMQRAIEAHETLIAFAPHAEFLIGTVSLNSKGAVTNTHLLMHERQGELAYLSSPTEQILAMQQTTPVKSAVTESQKPTNSNPNHPLQMRLTALSNERKAALKEISEKMVQQIHLHTEQYVPDFHSDFQNLLIEFEQIDRHEQARINKSLFQLYQEYPNMPLMDFISYVESSGMKKYFRQYLKKRKKLLGETVVTAEEFNRMLRKVYRTTTLNSLDRQVVKATEMLTLENLPNVEELVGYQNQFRTQVLRQVMKLIMSPVEDRSHPGSRATLAHILKSIWVTDQNEYEYFINEYDLIVDDND